MIAIGLGPFNLGLAALAEPVPDLGLLVLEARAEFRWHPGMLIEGTTLQVPFLADLVTMADPTSRWSFLNYLKQQGRLYPFYIRESFYPLRSEYDAYCRWVAERLPGIAFGHEVVDVRRDDHGVYRVTSATDEGLVEHLARRLVIGVGRLPYVPPAADLAPHTDGPALHSADYLPRRAELLACRSVTVVGSGQSAAEVFLDLLRQGTDEQRLTWVTRSPRFFSMEYTKLTLELTSPDYVDYFHGLDESTRDRIGRDHRTLYKGISGDLVDEIFDELYRRSVERPRATAPRLLSSTELVGMQPLDGRYRLRWRHTELDRRHEHESEGVVLATGYRTALPRLLSSLGDAIRYDTCGRPDVSRGYTVDVRDEVFVQNGEEHTHGLTAPDLGMGAHRSATIINAVTGRSAYDVEKSIAFQEFGACT